MRQYSPLLWESGSAGSFGPEIALNYNNVYKEDCALLILSGNGEVD